MKQSILTLLFIFLSMVCAKAQTELQNQYETAISSPLYAEAKIFGDAQEISNIAPRSNQHKSFDYKNTAEWKKFKVLRAVGWTSFGVGIPMTFYGLIGSALTNFESGHVYGPFLALAIIGGTMTLSSIPILISAYHYRNKAKRMILDVGMSHIASPTFATNNLNVAPALSFKLTF